jgi:methionyl-tRNA formyltransferase
MIRYAFYMPGSNLKIVFFGTPEFAVPSLRALLSSEHEVLAVVTQPDRQSGRGRKLKSPPVKEAASGSGIPVSQPERVKDPLFLKQLADLAPDVIVTAAYGQILPAEIIHMPPHGCLNIHASLLPKYRGASPVNMAIINGEEVTGTTIMLMDEGMDTGPLLLQEEMRIEPGDTAGTLSVKLSEQGARMVLNALEGLKSGSLSPTPQSGEPSYAPLLKKSDGIIDWSLPAEKVCSFIRGMNPWPAAWSILGGERMKILMAEPVPEPDGATEHEPGEIVHMSKDSMIVGTGGGLVSLREIQPPGKPPMPAKAFIQGRRPEPGWKFEGTSE